jgi:hypothetical protein
LFAASNARTVSEWVPFAAPVVFHDAEYGDVVSLESSAPSTRKSTRVTPTLSLAFAWMLMVPLTVAPAPGLAIDAVGAVVSPVAAAVSVNDPDLLPFPNVPVTVTRVFWVTADVVIVKVADV